MIKRRIGLDAVFQELIDQTVIEIEPFWIGRADAVGEDARPGDGEAICLDAERLDQLHILLVAMIMFVGAVAIAVVADPARRVRERVPDRWAAAVFVDGALDLVGRCRCAPDKTFWKRRGHIRARSLLRLARRLGRPHRQAERGKPGGLYNLPAR